MWFVAGLALVLGRRYWIAFGSGVAAVILPFVAANIAHSGTLLGLHASANLAPLSGDYLAARLQRVDAWLQPHSALASAGLFLVGAAWVGSVLNVDFRTRQVVGLAGVVAVAAAAGQRLLPRDSFWQVFPLCLLALIPTNALPPGARRLYVIAVVSVVGIVLTATHDGGAQWGARFLLVAAPPLIVLAAHGATEAMGAGRWQVIRIALVVLALIGGVATSRSVYLELRSAKREYARLVETTASMTNPGDVIVTNVWWFDQIAASLYRSRIFLYTADDLSAANALSDLSRMNVRRLELVWAADADASPNDIVRGSCFQVREVRDVPQHKLRLAAARCGTD